MYPFRHALPTLFRLEGWRLLALVVALQFACKAGAEAADLARLQRSAARAGPQAVSALHELLPLLRRAPQGGVTSQLLAVNLFFNRRIAFADDTLVWGQVDHWASPLEALTKGQGDCEDYAIAKYFSLMAAGVPSARLRLVYVRALLDGARVQAHMVLAYYPPDGSGPMILDNLVDRVVPAKERDDLSPVFSFNSQGLWQGVGSVGAGNPSARLSHLTRWTEVLAKARAEGF